MTPEQITEGLYEWLMRASRLDGLKPTERPARWGELSARDPELAAKWRQGVNLFLTAIEAKPDDEVHLNFSGSLLPEPELAPDGDPGDEQPPVRPDD